MAEKSGVQSVERIFQLIESLAAHPAGAGLQRLAQDTDLAKSTVHRLLASLVSLGYAAQDENGRYRLTFKDQAKTCLGRRLSSCTVSSTASAILTTSPGR